jgi:hypothetical protein
VILVGFVYIKGQRRPDLNDTWTWDGNDWRQVHSNSAPPWRDGAVFVYSDASKLSLLSGGFARKDTWTFDGSRWAERHSTNEPSARSGALAAYDPVGRQVIMFGGWPCWGCDRLTETWSWTDGEWQQLQPAKSPTSTTYLWNDLLFDPVKNRLTLFGSHVQLNSAQPTSVPDTWVWENSTWTEVQSSEAGPFSGCHRILYTDSGAGAIKSVAFSQTASESPCLSPVAQSWNGSNWTGNQPVHWAPPTASFRNAFFPPKQYLLTVGGDSCLGQANETWTWDGAVWNLLHPKTNPPPRDTTYLAYAGAEFKIVMFGGSSNGPCWPRPRTD